MSRKEKLKEKLLDHNQERNIGFDELCTLLEHLGFQRKGGKGSHQIFYRDDVEDLINLQPTKDGKAKPYQVRQVRGIVKAYEL